jgi:hypothetical protein
MALALSSVEEEGPAFAKRVRNAEEVVRKLEGNKFDFDSAPDIFAERSKADVVAKEIAHIHDGKTMTRVGRLIMGGIGDLFNLMGPLPANSVFRVTDTDRMLDEINHQLGTEGLSELPSVRKFGKPEKVDFFNYTNFYQLRDLVFWSVLYGSGAFPSTFEHMARFFARGDIVENMMYRPSGVKLDGKKPRIMAGSCLTVSFPSTVVEWMDKPLFGGFAKDTQHVEYLLTPEPSEVSHPYLPLVGEGVVEFGYRRYYIRRFAGVTPKDGLRGPNVSPESRKKSGGKK